MVYSETVSEVAEEEEQEDSEEEEVSDYSEDGEGWRSGRRSSRYGKATRRSSRKRGRHSIFKDFGNFQVLFLSVLIFANHIFCAILLLYSA